MSESKTYVFGNDANGGVLGAIAPLLQRQGLDPNMVMTMMNNRNGFCGEEAAYLTGHVGQLMFPKAKRFLCKCYCR